MSQLLKSDITSKFKLTSTEPLVSQLSDAKLEEEIYKLTIIEEERGTPIVLSN